MNPLGSLIDVDLAPGVHLWSSALDVAYVRGAVRRAGWGFAHLRGADLVTASAFHPAIAAALGFPEYYGRNLDALADCLYDCTGSQVLLWDDWGALARAEPRFASIVVDLLGSSRITTLLRGEGPSIPGVNRL